MQTREFPELLTAYEVAEILRIRPQTLSKWRMPGQPMRLPFVKVGRLIRYRADDVQRFMATTAAGDADGDD